MLHSGTGQEINSLDLLLAHEVLYLLLKGIESNVKYVCKNRLTNINLRLELKKSDNFHLKSVECECKYVNLCMCVCVCVRACVYVCVW